VTPKTFNLFFNQLRKDAAKGFRSELDVVLMQQAGETDSTGH